MRSLRAPFLSLAAVLVLLLSACGGDGGGSTGEAASSADASGGAVEFSAAKLGGGTLESASFEGEPTVLWFWAPWCTTCRAEAPHVTAGAQAFAGEVNVIGVAGRGEVDAMEAFVSDTGTEGLTHIVDDSGDIWTSYGVVAQPAFAFISADGSVEVVAGALGEDALVEKLDALSAA